MPYSLESMEGSQKIVCWDTGISSKCVIKHQSVTHLLPFFCSQLYQMTIHVYLNYKATLAASAVGHICEITQLITAETAKRQASEILHNVLINFRQSMNPSNLVFFSRRLSQMIR